MSKSHVAQSDWDLGHLEAIGYLHFCHIPRAVEQYLWCVRTPVSCVCTDLIRMSWCHGGVADLRGSFGRWLVSVSIHMNGGIQGFPAEYCTVV